MANKMKNKYGNPQKNIDAFKAAEAAKLAKEVDKQLVHNNTVPTSRKPMLMRILVLAVVAVMILGIVMVAAKGGSF
ncbi:MAG: hypothetical protein J5582_14260 [Ruminococcus sp.]|uniref:Uncharacterized protein n=1 Tax=Ruminococcus albus TaxID=1264 RepID=A0A1H7FKI7_RUMAL|nr:MULTISPECIES: hypothetical protein [Ruminococcus]MBO4867700.1 hypothetical protein [Ruminococcus sp.]SEK26314.1 hypothetical protein SAMN05216469_101304 [Ruminococcus albus]